MPAACRSTYDRAELGLRVEIEGVRLSATLVQRGGEIQCSGGFTDAALLIEYGNDAHGISAQQLLDFAVCLLQFAEQGIEQCFIHISAALTNQFSNIGFLDLSCDHLTFGDHCSRA